MKSKKELKDAYKEMVFTGGIFQLRNTVSGKLLLGSTTNCDAIWNRIRSELKLGGHRNAALQSDWNAQGQEQFCFEVLMEIKRDPDKKEEFLRSLKEMEELYMEELQPYGEKGYHFKKPINPTL